MLTALAIGYVIALVLVLWEVGRARDLDADPREVGVKGRNRR